MRTNIPEKLLKISDDIAAQGNVSLTRLTVLKKWFEEPGRLPSFAVWVASRASSRKGKTIGPAAELFKASRALLAKAERCNPQLDKAAVHTLHDRLQTFQNEYQNQQWGPDRIIHNWNLMLVETGLAVYLWHSDSPERGYSWLRIIAGATTRHPGNGLNGPSRTKMEEIVRFMFTIEALERHCALKAIFHTTMLVTLFDCNIAFIGGITDSRISMLHDCFACHSWLYPLAMGVMVMEATKGFERSKSA